HHEFPKDYRNGIRPTDYDPTKFLIWLASKVGLASDLFTVTDDEIQKAMIIAAEAHAATLRAAGNRLDWGPGGDSGDVNASAATAAALPILPTSSDPAAVTNRLGHADWLVLDGFVLDVAGFLDRHPGGARVLRGLLGKDATKAFYGSLNYHSVSARTHAATLRVGRAEAAGSGSSAANADGAEE
ncbi:hypothetical protein HK405_000830, partial [Cladochytrium tenue]